MLQLVCSTSYHTAVVWAYSQIISDGYCTTLYIWGKGRVSILRLLVVLMWLYKKLNMIWSPQGTISVICMPACVVRKSCWVKECCSLAAHGVNIQKVMPCCKSSSKTHLLLQGINIDFLCCLYFWTVACVLLLLSLALTWTSSVTALLSEVCKKSWLGVCTSGSHAVTFLPSLQSLQVTRLAKGTYIGGVVTLLQWHAIVRNRMCEDPSSWE